MLPDEDSINTILQPYIQPWYDSIENPQKAQEQILVDLVAKYGSTEYGANHNASQVSGITDYQANFPIINYSGLMQYLQQVKERSFKSFLSEPSVTWVMTRGSTGKSKVLPATQTHLKQIYSCGARGLINYAVRKKNSSFLRCYS